MNLQSNVIKEKGINFSVHSSSSLTVDWDEGWAKLLIGNIYQNVQKAFIARDTIYPERASSPKTLDVFIGQVTEESQTYMALMFEDTWIGFPEDLVSQQGFIKGMSDWGGDKTKGTGIGMAKHQQVLETTYNGKLRLENKRDESGNVIGAKLIILLPTKE